MRGRSAESLLRRAVILRGIRLGQPTDLLLGLAGMRVLGLDVLCGDDAERFLPFPAAQVTQGEILVDSALQLLDAHELAFYRRHATSFRALRGLPVQRDGRALGALADLVVDADGAVTELAVEDGGERELVPLGGTVTIGGHRTASAA